MNRKEKRCTVVLLLLGRYEVQTVQLDQKLRECVKLEKQAEIIIVADDLQWMAAPQLQMFRLIHTDITVMVCPQAKSLPAQAMNLGLSDVRTDYVIFSLLDDPLLKRFQIFEKQLLKKTNQKDFKEEINLFLENHSENAYYITPCRPPASQEVDPTPLNAYGWAQSTAVGFGLGSFCVPIALLRKSGNVDESPLLRTEIERWLALLVSRQCDLICAGTDSTPVRLLTDYPLPGKNDVPEDLAVRYAVYCHGIAARERTAAQCAQEFALDLNDEEYALYKNLTGISCDRKEKKPYKVLILGGYWEYHHNQICFFNYLEKLYGTGFATYRPGLEFDVPINVVLGYDLVIFTRCRSERALTMMRLCNARNISTLYMIDDNWISIAKDHPDQGAIFKPGNPNYDNFIEALGLCKATWLFSDLLQADVLPYTRCVKKFRISVDPEIFTVSDPRERTDEQLYVGFSGSLRYDDAAFRALARYARRNKNIRVILVGTLSEKQEQLFKNVNVLRIEFQSYSRYAKSMGRILPDLLIAPLPDTHTAQSKCYNKYVESGVIGAVGIYSNLKPYTDVIKDNINGYLIENETEEGWYEKLTEVLSDTAALRRVQRTAQNDILTHHTVDTVLGKFSEKLIAVIEECELQDD